MAPRSCSREPFVDPAFCGIYGTKFLSCVKLDTRNSDQLNPTVNGGAEAQISKQPHLDRSMGHKCIFFETLFIELYSITCYIIDQ
jgi:hypothetical protein